MQLDLIGRARINEASKNHVNDLKAYKARHGLFVGTLIRAFLNGVQTIEELERVNLGLTLTADRIEALDAIGFDWRSEGISRTQER
jgi:hypothetical protein